MIVTPIAHTVFHTIPESILDSEFADRLKRERSYHNGIDDLHEFAGRSCYQSWSLPNPKTADNEGYMANIIAQGHGSVMEHGSVTFYLEGVSRSLTHELIRHRHLSFSELSQRYVDIEELEIVTPPALRGLIDLNGIAATIGTKLEYARLVKALMKKGYKRKQAREAARAVIPGGIETKMVVTGNIRAWRDVLGKRHHEAADAEIQELARTILGHLRYLAPNSVQDIPSAPYGSDQ